MAHKKFDYCARCMGTVVKFGWQPKEKDEQGNELPFRHKLLLPAVCHMPKLCEQEHAPYKI